MVRPADGGELGGREQAVVGRQSGGGVKIVWVVAGVDRDLGE